MLNGRIYRAASVPVLVAVAVAAFSLGDRPAALNASLAPDAFDGPATFAELRQLETHFPRRRPGGRGDRELAGYVARTLSALGGTAAGGFQVATRSVQVQTIDGPRTLANVVAQRPGTSDAKPLVVLAARDAAGAPATAQLSATAVLLGLARVFAASETRRTIVLVSTSGASGGSAGAAEFLATYNGSADAAIVLGDLAGEHVRRPFVVPFSAGLGSAPLGLQRTVSGAIAHELGGDPGTPSTLAQLAHLALPLSAGGQAPLQAGGMPAVLVQLSGERDPPAREPVSAARLQSLGRAVLSAIYALDAGPDVSPRAETGVPIQHKVMPGWAVRMLLGALLLAPLLVLVDALARLRRRRERLGRWVLWALACALPFLAAALFARLLGSAGALAAPPGLVPAGALPAGAAAPEAGLAVALVLALGWLAWPALLRRMRLRPRPHGDGAAVALLLVLVGVASAVWLVNPFAALLLVPALNLWLLLVWTDWLPPGRTARRLAGLAVVALGLAPLALLLAFYAHRLGYGAGGLPHAALLLLAGGYGGVVGVALASLALGCAAGAVLVACAPVPDPLGAPDGPGAPPKITVRGPLSYAGPGSLGGTESALRR
ncbi:MAG TPA: hypothetical protein VID29_11115 [Solirubrobacteraceae bacterium]